MDQRTSAIFVATGNSGDVKLETGVEITPPADDVTVRVVVTATVEVDTAADDVFVVEDVVTADRFSVGAPFIEVGMLFCINKKKN